MTIIIIEYHAHSCISNHLSIIQMNTTTVLEEAARRIGANRSFEVPTKTSSSEGGGCDDDDDDDDDASWWKRQWWIAVGGDSDTDSDTSSAIIVINHWMERLWALHTETTRHYHTVVHLREMLEYVQALEESNIPIITQNSDAGRILRLATFFHDAIYDPKGTQNEVQSAQLFQEFCDEALSSSNINMDEPIRKAVNLLILATEKHQVIEVDDDVTKSDAEFRFHLQKYFLDIDMAVLGKEPEAYMAYSALIRKEYAHVPRDVYCEKRAEILKGFCDPSRQIFLSDIFHRMLETRAKQNLQAEIRLLTRGLIPGEN